MSEFIKFGGHMIRKSAIIAVEQHISRDEREYSLKISLAPGHLIQNSTVAVYDYGSKSEMQDEFNAIANLLL